MLVIYWERFVNLSGYLRHTILTGLKDVGQERPSVFYYTYVEILSSFELQAKKCTTASHFFLFLIFTDILVILKVSQIAPNIQQAPLLA